MDQTELARRIAAARQRFLDADPLDVAEYDEAQKALAELRKQAKRGH